MSMRMSTTSHNVSAVRVKALTREVDKVEKFYDQLTTDLAWCLWQTQKDELDEGNKLDQAFHTGLFPSRLGHS